jgi:hypothetical protein
MRSHRLAVGFILTVGLFLGLSSPVQAGSTTYDLAADWSDTTNPNGTWAYGLLSPSLQFSPFTQVVDQGTIDPGDFNGYQPSWFGPAPASLMKSRGVSDYDFPTGSVGGHTPLVGTGYLAVQWTAPSASTVDLSGGTWMWRSIGRTESISLFIDGKPLFSDVTIPGQSDGVNSSNPFTLADAIVAAGGSASGLMDISVQAGDTITLAVSAVNEQDFVGLDFTINASSVPEPASVVLIGLGSIGMLGYTWARGRRHRVASV